MSRNGSRAQGVNEWNKLTVKRSRLGSREPHPFMSIMGDRPRMPDSDLHTYARRVKAGTAPDGRLNLDARAARDAIVEASLPLAFSWASRNNPADLDFDLALEATLQGLQRAAELYDPDYLSPGGNPYRFSTYAVRWFAHYVNLAREEAFLVHVPRWAAIEVRKVDRLAKRGELPDVSPATIASHLRVRRDKAELIYAAWAVNRGIMGRIHIGSDWRNGEEMDLVDGRTPGAGMSAATRERADAMRRALDVIPPRHAEVLRLRYGLGGVAPLTTREISEVMGVGERRVYQLERSAMRSLQAAMEGRRTWGGGKKPPGGVPLELAAG